MYKRSCVYQCGRLCAMIIRADQIDGYLATADHAPPPSVVRHIPHIPREHARYRYASWGSRPIRSRMADSLVKSRFAPPISLKFSQHPGPRPVCAHPRFRFYVGRYFFRSVEGVISLFFFFFFYQDDLRRVGYGA